MMIDDHHDNNHHTNFARHVMITIAIMVIILIITIIRIMVILIINMKIFMKKLSRKNSWKLSFEWQKIFQACLPLSLRLLQTSLPFSPRSLDHDDHDDDDDGDGDIHDGGECDHDDDLISEKNPGSHPREDHDKEGEKLKTNFKLMLCSS